MRIDPFWTALPELRYVEKDGKLVLQQVWGLYVCRTEDKELILSSARDWKDVPLSPSV